MRPFIIALVTAVTLGCSQATPTTPSFTTSITESDTANSMLGLSQKVTLYFFSDDDPSGGNVHIVGLPVNVQAMPSGISVDLATNRQGSVSLRVPESDTSILVTTVTWNRFCGIQEELPLPVRQIAGWIFIHEAC